ncbi:MAG: VWA domain-containing protein [Oligoflexales bacterium]|nr:VWA domain-containing protein [Oligoflexales bacterium]
MNKVFKNLVVSSVYAGLIFSGVSLGKSIKNKYGVTQGGKVPQSQLNGISYEIQSTLGHMDQSHYEDIVANPELAVNDEERLAALSAREIFILVDRSGSMNAPDENPSGMRSYSQNWTRWDSARVAAESISELAIALDADNKIDIMLWDGDMYGKLNYKYETMTHVGQIGSYFTNNKPQRGSTPLYEALNKVYQDRLRPLLQKSEPFTVIILTDGAPNNRNTAKNFFKTIIRENNLETPGRETLAAFSFVRMGDDEGAMAFLEDLDDNLISQLGVNVDIVDTKEDNFLFGTGKFQGQEGIGPLAVFWDALYD